MSSGRCEGIALEGGVGSTGGVRSVGAPILESIRHDMSDQPSYFGLVSATHLVPLSQSTGLPRRTLTHSRLALYESQRE